MGCYASRNSQGIREEGGGSFILNACKGGEGTQWGYFQIRRSGGLGPHIKFGGKIWGKVRPSSPNKRKNLGRSVTTRCKSREKVPILGSYLKFRGQNLGYLSFIFLEAKFWGSNKNFRGKIWGQAPRPPYMEVPPPPGKVIPNVCYISLNMFDVHSFCCCINLHLKTLGIPALSYMYVWFTKGI